VTVTLAVLVVAMAEAGIEAVSSDALMIVVGSGVPPKLRVEVGRKLDPYTVNVNAAPAVSALAGTKLEMEGVGLEVAILKFTKLEAPPPGAGFDT
jgi:hypothetical protein